MSHSGAAIFKKVYGIINIDEDASPAQLIWRSTAGDDTHTVLLDSIDKLQATPATSSKMMLRLIGKTEESSPTKKQKTNENGSNAAKPESHMFSFNNRAVMDNIKLTLQTIISRYKDIEADEEKRKMETPDVQKQNQQQQNQQHNGELINTERLDDSLSKEKLLINLKLQQSLLKNNKILMRTFQETVINSGLPPEEFWSTRIALLRAFALSTSQKVGPYNVLSTIKPVASSENKVNVNLSRQKILSIFENYPIVKKAYDDNVPKNFKEQEFWARFFSSKLFRKLRGEKLMANDRGDVIIDRYLTLDQEYDRQDDERLMHPVNKYIDIEGNKEDDPVRMGNKPDFTMQPGTDPNGNNDGTIDILKGMNRLSEKMIMALENEYSRNTLQKDSIEDESKEIFEITDLEKDYEAQYAIIHLNNNEKNKNESLQNSDDRQISEDVIESHIKKVLDHLILKLELNNVVSDTDANNENSQRVISAVKLNAKQAKHNTADSMLRSFVGNSNDTEATSDIPPDLLESCRILNSTCCEFLKHFYIHFQSGEPKKGILVNKLYKQLKDCSSKLKELFNDVLKHDGEQMSNTVTSYLKPVFDSILFAIEKYNTAFTEFNKDILHPNSPN